jgi:preprotein translocase subunit YajC
MEEKEICGETIQSSTRIQSLNGLQLSQEQARALEILQSGDNVFLTGGAGCGKSFVIRELMRSLDTELYPLLASTGAAAVLVGGRTFHSFFGLGIMEGGFEAAREKALGDRRLRKRLKNIEGIVIDEVSMIPGAAFSLAEELARTFRESSLPWGGLRVICVGDFMQLPPVTRSGGKRDWAFVSRAWESSDFQKVLLRINQRVDHTGDQQEFVEILNELREGARSRRLADYLNSRVRGHDLDEEGVRLFPRRLQADEFNQFRLSQIAHELVEIPSIYMGDEKQVEALKKSAPVGETIRLKIGCMVMLIQNDPNKRWVNGTIGEVVDIQSDCLRVRKKNGRDVKVDKSMFSLLDAEGNVRASVIQFPVALAYASTIHKSQGATLDEIWCDLRNLWEPGHAYVAVSRLTHSKGLNLIGWTPRSIITDPQVVRFYSGNANPSDSIHQE